MRIFSDQKLFSIHIFFYEVLFLWIILFYLFNAISHRCFQKRRISHVFKCLPFYNNVVDVECVDSNFSALLVPNSFHKRQKKY